MISKNRIRAELARSILTTFGTDGAENNFVARIKPPDGPFKYLGRFDQFHEAKDAFCKAHL